MTNMLWFAFFVNVLILTLVNANVIPHNNDGQIVNVYNWNFFTSPFNVSNATNVPQIDVRNVEEDVEDCEAKAALQNPMIYWKDYNFGKIPSDAILAGERQEPYNDWPEKMYIGQAVFNVEKSGIQPVVIRYDRSYVTNTYTQFVESTKNVKILCTNVKPEDFDKFLTWIPAEEALDYEAEKDFVITGTEHSKVIFDDVYLYSGRANYGDEYGFVVGKVIMGHNKWRFYFVHKRRHEVEKKEGFEILAYKSALNRPKSISSTTMSTTVDDDISYEDNSL